MAVGTVSGISPEDNWQLISSVTPSGTSHTFSSLTGYKHLWVIGKGITKSGADYIGMRPNNDTTAGNYGLGWASGTSQTSLIANTTAAAQGVSAKIYNIDQAIPHKIDGTYDANQWSPADAYVNPVVITSLVIHCYTTGSFTGGTLSLYGIPA
jgi:hypothetical protein